MGLGRCAWMGRDIGLTFGRAACPSPHVQASKYAHAIEDQENQALEMSPTQEIRNPSAITSLYETPALNLLLLELEGAQALATQLKTKAGASGATDLLHQLQEQVCGLIDEPFLPFTASCFF